jgi:hypothetical protein
MTVPQKFLFTLKTAGTCPADAFNFNGGIGMSRTGYVHVNITRKTSHGMILCVFK